MLHDNSFGSLGVVQQSLPRCRVSAFASTTLAAALAASVASTTLAAALAASVTSTALAAAQTAHHPEPA